MNEARFEYAENDLLEARSLGKSLSKSSMNSVVDRLLYKLCDAVIGAVASHYDEEESIELFENEDLTLDSVIGDEQFELTLDDSDQQAVLQFRDDLLALQDKMRDVERERSSAGKSPVWRVGDGLYEAAVELLSSAGGIVESLEY